MNQLATQTGLDSAWSDWPRGVNRASFEIKPSLKDVVPRSPECCELRSRSCWLRFNEIGAPCLPVRICRLRRRWKYMRENIPGKGCRVWSDACHLGQYESPIAPLTGLGP